MIVPSLMIELKDFLDGKSHKPDTRAYREELKAKCQKVYDYETSYGVPTPIMDRPWTPADLQQWARNAARYLVEMRAYGCAEPLDVINGAMLTINYVFEIMADYLHCPKCVIEEFTKNMTTNLQHVSPMEHGPIAIQRLKDILMAEHATKH